MTLKTCSCCGLEKSIEDFGWHYKDRGIRRNECKPCRSNKEKLRQRQEHNRVKRKDYTLTRDYGITLEEYNNMFTAQEGKCAICGTHQTELNRALAVDHCHTNGNVRSLLCSPCNTGLGQFRDNVELLRRAADYLEAHDQSQFFLTALAATVPER